MSSGPMGGDASAVTDDAILNGRLRLLQPKRGHRFGHDAILLAAAVPAAPGARFAELGAGVGAASLALLSRVPQTDGVLIEIDATLVALANDNIARNGFAARARAIALDVTAPLAHVAAAGLRPTSFDHVLMNPPFNDASHQPSPDAARRLAHAGPGLVPDWIATAHALLKDGGSVTVIWRAEGLAEMLAALDGGFGGGTTIPVYPAPDRAAIRVIVTAIKSSRAPARIAPALILNNDRQRPTDEAEFVLRHGGAWPPDAALR